MARHTEKVCIGIDVGGTNLRFTLVGVDGTIHLRERQPTLINLGKDDFLERFFGAITSMRTEARYSGREVAAIGAGVPGLISNDGFIYSSVNLRPLEGMNFREIITSETGLPAYIINDANASAWGEKCYGAGQTMGSFLLLTLGTGVGSGLILDGRLWTGRDGVAGEYGHATVEPLGKQCPCGNRGCLEQYASANAIVAAAREAIHAGVATGMLANVPEEEVSGKLLADAAGKGDNFARLLFQNAGRYLGIAAASALNLLNLDGIVLGGGVAASFDLLIESMHSEIMARAFAIPAQRVRIVQSSLEDDAGILGAAALAFSCF